MNIQMHALHAMPAFGHCETCNACNDDFVIDCRDAGSEVIFERCTSTENPPEIRPASQCSGCAMVAL